jgi:hypothetical protein
MSWEGVPATLVPLAESAKIFFEGFNPKPTIEIMSPLRPSFSWRPHLKFQASDHLIVTAEASSNPYPGILKMRAADLMRLSDPIAVYNICPLEALGTADGHAKKRELRDDGFGLLVVDSAGIVTVEFRAIPLIQHISRDQFDAAIAPLKKAYREPIRRAYQMYCDEPISGVRELSEPVEGVVLSAVRRGVAKKWLKPSAEKKLAADQLDLLYETPQFKAARGAIGGARNYIKQYRNPAAHYPRSRSAAIEKYKSVRMAFFTGVKVIDDFDRAMRGCGLSIAL